MMGLLGDITDDPATMGLLSLGFGLMGARGNIGQGLGQAGPMALEAMRQAKADQQRKAMQAQQTQMTALQLQQLQQALSRQQSIDALAPQFVQSPQMNAMRAGGGPTAAAAAAVGSTPASFDYAGYANALAGIDPTRAIGIQTAMRKELPKLSKLEPMRDNQGQMVNVAVFEDGTTKILPFGVKPDIALQSLGNKVISIDKNQAPNGASWAMGASPDALVTAGTAARGQDMTAGTAAARLAFDKEAAGGMEYKQDANGDWMALPKKPAGNSPIVPVPVSAPNKNVKAARDALGIIDQARGLIDKSTGSYLGAGVDMAAQVVGGSTSGAQAAAKLKALEGALMLRQPRMEGPQSDKDVALYRQMAAQIGDSTVPAKTKLAALDTIQELHERYAGIKKPETATPVIKPGSTIRFDANGMMVVGQ